MRARTLVVLAAVIVGALTGAIQGGCVTAASPAEKAQPLVVAGTSFLADIAQNVAGGRLQVTPLIPIDADPHSYEPTPRSAADIARADLLILNSQGFEPLVDSLVDSGGARPGRVVVEAAAGLQGRNPGSREVDPHFWLDPTRVIRYVINIRDGLTEIDPPGADEYARNAETYTGELRVLDSWIAQQVSTIPMARRLLVTNHESFGYFAERYGFRIVGTVFETMGAEGTPSAQQLADLVRKIRASGAPAIFLETGSIPDLAEQVSRETGVPVVSDLYTHSLGKSAKTYLEMMRWNVEKIVQALR